MVKEEKKENKEDFEIVVVRDIPTSPVREYTDEETGKKMKIMTIEERIEDIGNKVDKMYEAIV